MPPRNTIDKVLARVDCTGSCWIWTGSVSPEGYGKVAYQRRTTYVHRLMYETFVGPIPPKMHIDHLCRNRICCRPGHLEVVTNQENVLRGAHSFDFNGTCNKGLHDVTQPDGFYIEYGKRHCRQCQRDGARRRRQRRQQAQAQNLTHTEQETAE